MPDKHKFSLRLFLHILILTNYGACVLMLLRAARERWDLARDPWLCGTMLTAFILAMLAAIFRTKKHVSAAWPWLLATGSFIAALAGYILRWNW